MWNLDRINKYIANGVEESLFLEYKGAGALGKTEGKKSEISKDVSAFANSAGGIIIYGIKEFDGDTPHLPERIDPILRSDFSKEWLEQIINSNISPKIQGISISPIPIDDHNVLYVVEISQSNTAHQSKDKRYYRRYNFESIPMEDYEIKDIINRQNKSNILIEFIPRLDLSFIKRQLENRGNFNLEQNIWIKNTGNRLASYVDIFIYGNAEASKHFIDPMLNNNGLHFSNTVDHKIRLKDNEYTVNTSRLAILPNTSRNIGKIKISSQFIYNNCFIDLQISTEDYSKNVRLRDKQIISNL